MTIPMRSPEVIRTWRSAIQSAVRQYGAGAEADRAAMAALRRFMKRMAKRPKHMAHDPRGTLTVERA